MTHSCDNPPACTTCGSARVAWVMQGLPNFEDEELMRLVDEKRVILGGCCDGRYWRCLDCDAVMYPPRDFPHRRPILPDTDAPA